MSKIIKAINAMTLHPDLISDAYRGMDNKEHVIFFVYDKKYNWSIHENHGDYTLLFYPKNKIDEIAGMDDGELRDLSSIDYDSAEFSGREVKASFRDLYLLVQEKASGMDKILDDIIGDTFAYGS